MMIPHFYSGLPAIADVATYFTRVVPAYALCVGLARLTSRPQVRFVIWASFLFGAGTYWVLLVVDHVLGVAGAAPLVLVTGGGTPTSAPSVATWLLPTAWRTHIEDGGALVAR